MRTEPTPAEEAAAKLVAANVRAEMERQRLSQQALADKLGWTQPYVSRRLNPKNKPNGQVFFTAGELVAVARVLGVPVARLLPESEAAR